MGMVNLELHELLKGNKCVHRNQSIVCRNKKRNLRSNGEEGRVEEGRRGKWESGKGQAFVLGKALGR
jgi:hypothetical protein